jgi:signal transduction histidine kinase
LTNHLTRCSAAGLVAETAGHQGTLTGHRSAGTPLPDEGLQRLRETCHDIRQPVAGVLALATAALADPGVPVVTRSYLEQIVNQAQSLGEVIQRRLHAEEPAEANARLTDLGWLAEEAAATERVTYEGRLEIVPHAEPVVVCVNQTDARAVISNLLSNATRAAGPDGAVTIEISRDSGLAQLVVEDTGPGFGKIPGGTGLGWRVMARSLATCRGKISYGRGSRGGVRASFWLPLAAA